MELYIIFYHILNIKENNFKLLPDRATIFLEAIEDEEYKNKKIHFWDNV